MRGSELLRIEGLEREGNNLAFRHLRSREAGLGPPPKPPRPKPGRARRRIGRKAAGGGRGTGIQHSPRARAYSDVFGKGVPWAVSGPRITNRYRNRERARLERPRPATAAALQGLSPKLGLFSPLEPSAGLADNQLSDRLRARKRRNPGAAILELYFVWRTIARWIARLAGPRLHRRWSAR